MDEKSLVKEFSFGGGQFDRQSLRKLTIQAPFRASFLFLPAKSVNNSG